MMLGSTYYCWAHMSCNMGSLTAAFDCRAQCNKLGSNTVGIAWIGLLVAVVAGR